MTWHTRPFVSFDTETTGINPETDRIVTAALVTINPATGDTTTREWLANPGIDIPDGATAVHGITTEHAQKNGAPAPLAVGEIAADLATAWNNGLPVVVYNAAYDLTLLDRELRRHHGRELAPGVVIDPLVIDKQVDRFRRGSRKLVDTAKHYRITLTAEDAHGATADALAAARVAWKLARVYPELAEMDVRDLHAKQIAWRAEQCASFEEHLRKQGSTEVVNPEWPLHTFNEF